LKIGYWHQYQSAVGKFFGSRCPLPPEKGEFSKIH
jgi:hypothetical protein